MIRDIPKNTIKLHFVSKYESTWNDYKVSCSKNTHLSSQLIN